MNLPNEGDAVISPSALLLVGRVGSNNSQQEGYRLHKLDIQWSPDGGTAVSVPEIARYCFNGGTPAFSYDERWLVFHHYIGEADAVDLGFNGPSDPGFAQYRSQGAANVYVVDLTTGQKRRVTRMAPGQYALSPHFRSDGWIYFNVRVLGSTTEYIVASDAALLLSGSPP